MIKNVTAPLILQKVKSKPLVFLFTLFSVIGVRGQTGIAVPEMNHCDQLVINFLNRYDIPGATFALAKEGKIVYMRGFGYADINKTTPVQPYNLFRIASLSKPVTSIAIMKMIEEGKISLSSKVFGPGGILEHHPFLSGITITDNRVFDITVQHLLEHSAGWNRSIGCTPNPTAPYPWFFTGCDPIDFPLHVTAQTGTSNPVTGAAHIAFLLQKGLNFSPGTMSSYSNIGYLVLGEIIEQVSAMSYEQYVKQTILAPLGIYDMHIGKSLLSEKLPREGEYTGNGYSTLSMLGDGTYVPWEYGGVNISAMDAHGGWIATARDLVRLITAVDGFDTKPDILQPSTIYTMKTPSSTDANYAKGWQVNSADNWWHTGALHGTASFMARTSGGYTWAIILNKRSVNNDNFWGDLDALPWNCIAPIQNWPQHDLMTTPVTNASALTFSNIKPKSITVDWKNGSGERRLLLMRKGAAVDDFPLDGQNYTANNNFSLAQTVGAETRVVYDGTGSSASITGLDPEQTYFFRVVEYNRNLETGNNALYQLGGNATAQETTTSVLPVKLTSFSARRQESGSVVLLWQTTEEIFNDRFEVERSSDGIYYSVIGTVKGKGDGRTLEQYQFTDLVPDTGINYYRLKQVDVDGKQTYSTVSTIIAKPASAMLLSPNPGHSTITIMGINPKEVSVVDLSGRVILRYLRTAPGPYKVDIGKLATGVYLLKATDENRTMHVQRLVKL